MRGDMIDMMVQLVEDHKLRPPIRKVDNWQEAKNAFEALVKKEAVGKTVIEFGQEAAAS